MQGGGGRTITWTSFNQVKRVQNSGNTIFSEFTFGASHERIKEVAHNATTVFIGSLFERVTSGSLICYRFFSDRKICRIERVRILGFWPDWRRIS